MTTFNWIELIAILLATVLLVTLNIRMKKKLDSIDGLGGIQEKKNVEQGVSIKL